jgi:hypothetical protein
VMESTERFTGVMVVCVTDCVENDTFGEMRT